MKKIILAFLLFSAFINVNAQTYVKFRDNGLLNSPFYGPIFFSPLNKAKADKVLKSAIALDIPKKHINGYCEVRAEFLCKKLAPLVYGPNCEIGKIWAFAPSIYTLVSDKKLSHKNSLFNNEIIEWDYHVAPALVIQNGNKIDTVIIDFSIKDKAFIPYKEWLSQLNCKDAIYTFTDDYHYLFNSLDGLPLTGTGYNNITMPGNFPKIITGHFRSLDPKDSIDATAIPNGLAYNELAILLVDKYFNNPKYSQYRDQIRYATTQSGLKDIINGTILGLPDDLIDASKKYFIERSAYWTKLDKN